MTKKEKDLLTLLDIIIQSMMLIEKLESFQIENHYNKQLIKQSTKRLLDVIVPAAERDYGVVFKNGEKETQNIIREYENFIVQIRDMNVPQKVILSQLITAWNLEPGKIQDACNLILNRT